MTPKCAATPDGVLIDDATWGDWLPSVDDGDFNASLITLLRPPALLRVCAGSEAS